MNAPTSPNRRSFNHFATRQDMIRALVQRRLVNLHDVVFDRAHEAGILARLIGVFDDIAAVLLGSGDTRLAKMFRQMLYTWSGYGIQRGSNLHDTFVELVKEGVARAARLGRDTTQKPWPTSSLAHCQGARQRDGRPPVYSLQTNLHNLDFCACQVADRQG